MADTMDRCFQEMGVEASTTNVIERAQVLQMFLGHQGVPLTIVTRDGNDALLRFILNPRFVAHMRISASGDVDAAIVPRQGNGRRRCESRFPLDGESVVLWAKAAMQSSPKFETRQAWWEEVTNNLPPIQGKGEPFAWVSTFESEGVRYSCFSAHFVPRREIHAIHRSDGKVVFRTLHVGDFGWAGWQVHVGVNGVPTKCPNCSVATTLARALSEK
jgi:hypothetical protein